MENNTLLGIKGIQCEVFWIGSTRGKDKDIEMLNDFLRKNESKIVSIQPIGMNEYTSEILVTYICE
jgi:hypothetical protein